jgi:cysteine desulfurase/selenocysteine lyase
MNRGAAGATAPPRAGAQGPALDARAVRTQFPIFREPRQQPLRYLDSAATSQKPDAVLNAMSRYYATCNSNIHRGVYRIAEEATAAYEDARRRVAAFVGAASPREIVFTRNSTEAMNLVANAWGRDTLRAGDAIVLTEMEHHSNLVPWHILAGLGEGLGAAATMRRSGAATIVRGERDIEIRYIPVTGSGELDLSVLPGLLSDGRVRLVGVVHVSNVLGTINPVAEIARQAHAAGARVLVDASQSVPHFRVDVRALDADFVAFTGHKMLGPTGIGVLWGRRELLEAMPPFLGGGEMIREVQLSGSKWNELPWKFEAGTMPIAEAVGLGAAVDYLNALGMDAVFAHDRELTEYTVPRLAEIPGVRLLGPPPGKRGGVVAFTLEGVHAHDVATVLDADGVAVRAGHHCAMPLHEALGVPASVRASFHCYSLPEEVDVMIQGVRRAREVFSK